MIYKLNYSIEYPGLGKVMWYPRTYSTWYVAENKEVPDRIILAPVRKNANYHTLVPSVVYEFLYIYIVRALHALESQGRRFILGGGPKVAFFAAGPMQLGLKLYINLRSYLHISYLHSVIQYRTRCPKTLI